nr:symplekin [Onthophagus taurus]
MDDFFSSDDVSDSDLVAQWLNTAAVSQSPAERLEIFHKIQEVLTRKSPYLLNEYLANVLSFTTDRNSDVRKALVGFIEDICKQDENMLIKVMETLYMLLYNESVPVQKRVIQATITIYRRALSWLCKVNVITKEMEECWVRLNTIKVEIVNMIDSDNDGIRTSSVKFLECVVLLQSYPDPNENRPTTDFSLDDVPLTLKVARRRKLEEEANNIFALLIKFIGSQHVSSANLFACIGALTNIGKNRPVFLEQVINSIEKLLLNLPPTLSTTQVNSVRKKLKSEVSGLLKHNTGSEYQEKLTTMLTELGCSQSEITKMIPKDSIDKKRLPKRSLQTTETEQIPKKARLEIETDLGVQEKQISAIELNTHYIIDNLPITAAVSMVLSGFVNLPDSMPLQFKNDYADMLKTSPSGDIKMIAKILAHQFVEVGVGPGSKIIGKSTLLVKLPWKIPEEEKKDDKVEKDKNDKQDKEKHQQQPQPVPPPKKERVKVPRIKTLKLAEITKPLEKEVKENLLSGAIKRILQSSSKGVDPLGQKIIVTVASTFNEIVRDQVLTYLLSDLRNQIDLALAWLYEEYSIMQGFTRLPDLRRNSRLDQSYTTLLHAFVNASAHDPIILSRLLLEAPSVTEQVLDQLCTICRDETRCNWAMGLLRDLIIRRPPRQTMYLNALLCHCTHENQIIRDCAAGHMIDLYKDPNLRTSIEKYTTKMLEYLQEPQPTPKLFGMNQGRLEGLEVWTDDIAKACLQPYITLLPQNDQLIHKLTKIYIQANADIKRIILRLLENPIRLMGIDSSELLKLVEECPKGAETLVTRVIQILTDKGPPSPQLVQIVRDLYNSRVSDVRFLIPVLNGLNKKEVIAALPKLIKLTPVVVREVFNRLLGAHGESNITATELLVALHVIDQSKVDLKTILKATSMCLSEKQIFTQEVLAVVLQQLMDQPTLPTLLMRTVIQALTSYPRLSGFVMNILQRLILKQVWKNRVVWEGFVKCCQRTKPQSFSVLMQLPVPQLIEALEMCVELKVSLKEHLMTFSESQRSHIPVAVQDAILGPEQPPPISPTITTPTEKLTDSTTILNEPLPPGME